MAGVTIVAGAMNLVPPIARLVVSRLGWLFATGDERDAGILALGYQPPSSCDAKSVV